MRPRRWTSRSSGFTLIELVVVLLVVGILAGSIVPRLVGQERRAAEATAKGVREMLSALGTRAMLSPQASALSYDSTLDRLIVEVRKVADNPADFDRVPTWEPDPLTAPVVLGDLELRSAWINGATADVRRLRVEMSPGAERPSISLLLVLPKEGGAWRVDLPARSGRATVVTTTEGDPGPGEESGVVDLDRGGQGEVAW
ncbi:MAG: prepilin-type N-terminal cleavage/methylation domain-containing protein [Phycisphaeraceae bacterium]|nr:MAG: prepilin-type N-terminal cleavage/methylation domain-containing protein [Phycisphaeraceae bacterium]